MNTWVEEYGMWQKHFSAINIFFFQFLNYHSLYEEQTFNITFKSYQIFRITLFLIPPFYPFHPEIERPVLNSTNMVGGTFQPLPGTRHDFYCKTDGVPFPQVTWKKDGVDLDPANMSGVEIRNRNQNLVIRRVFEKDEGFYQCVVSNRGGVVYGNATLDIVSGKSILK